MSKKADARKARQAQKNAHQHERQARHASHLEPNKEREIRTGIQSTDTAQLLFDFTIFDYRWMWGKSTDQDHCVATICEKLKCFSTMTWNDLKKPNSKHHNPPVDKLSPEAKERLLNIKQDDIDSLWSLRLGIKPRLWGIRQGSKFLVLWWDPTHQVYPMDVKNNHGNGCSAVCSLRH